MCRLLRLLCAPLALASASVSVAHAASYSFSRIAGAPQPAGSADGIGTDARFNLPGGIAVDAAGNVYVADVLNNTIRKITPAGAVTTLAGTPGVTGTSDGTGAAAQFNQPWGIAVAASGNVFVCDYANNTIRRITPAGVVTTFAGEPGVKGSNEGTGITAHFYSPTGIVIDKAGNLYVSDRGNRTIRKITSAGVVSTLAGLAGYGGNTDGTGSNARFNGLALLAIDANDVIYAADSSSHTIRKITTDGVVTTLAGSAGSSGSVDGVGTAAKFSAPRGLAVDASGNVFVGDTGNDAIRKITPAGTTSVVAGFMGLVGNDNGTGSTARFYSPTGLAFDASGNLYVADSANDSIRKITPAGVVSLLAGGGGNFGSSDGFGSAARFYLPTGIALANDGALIVTDSYNCTVRRVTPEGAVTTLAGTPGGYGYVDSTLADSRFYYPYSVATDSNGSIWISDSLANAVRRISPAGTVRTYAGTPGSTGGSADGAYNVGQFNHPHGLALDASGNLYVADALNHTIRKVSTTGVISTLAGMAGTSGTADGTGTAARFNNPNGITFGPDGALYVSDTGNSAIRKVTLTGAVTTFAGLPGYIGSTDATGTSARFYLPAGLAFDGAGNLFVADNGNYTIRKISPAGGVVTIGGLAGTYGLQDGTGSSARFLDPSDIVVDAAGNLYIVDSIGSIVVKGALDQTPVIKAQPQSTTVLPGSTAVLSVVATGGGLSYQWQLNGAVIPGATNSTFSVSNAQPAQGGTYAVVITNSAGTVTSTAAPLYVNANAAPGRIFDLAIRSQAGTGSDTLAVGFSLAGPANATKSLLIRAAGPTLGTIGVGGAMVDPMLEVYTAGPTGTKIAENDDWGGNAQVITAGNAVGAFPFDSSTSKDAALYNTTLAQGGYTAQVSGKNGGTGVALAEIYDTSSTTSPLHLINVSARTHVGTGNDVLIAGIVIHGDTQRTVLIRGVGPTLGGYGVNGTLADPKLELYNVDGVKIGENDDWGGTRQFSDAFDAVGAFHLPASSKDAAMLVTLNPGNYSVQVSGVGNTTGVALVEVYEMP